MNEQIKSDSTANPNRAEIKELIKRGKAFSFIGETISKAYETPEGDYFIECIGSSDQEDLVGDVMTEKALKTMERDFVGKTVFMNHRTMVPDDVFGSIVEARLEKKDGVQLLWFKIVVEKENDAAMKTWRVIAGGRVQLGTSVTVLVSGSKPNPRRKGGILIDDVEPIEHSIVGVPCNRESRALVASASKALDLAAKDFTPESEEATGDEPENLIEKGEPEMKIDEANAAETAAAEVTPETAAEVAADETAAPAEETPKSAPLTAPLFSRTLAAIAAARSIREQIAAKATGITEKTVTVKGLFNEILEQEPTLWELYDILCEVKWDLMSQKWRLEYLGQTDFSEVLAQWDEALDEFKAAAVSSFRFWGDFDREATVIENSLEVAESFMTLSDLYEKTTDEDTRGLLRETGKSMLETAKSMGIVFESAAMPADTQTDAEITVEQIEKSAAFVKLKTEHETLQKQFDELSEEHEVAKAALGVSIEALQENLREPLDVSSQSATS